MIKISICGAEEIYNNSLSSWIKEQYHNRKKAEIEFWFIIKINTNGIRLTLPSKDAPQSRGKPISEFNQRERQIIDLWKKMNIRDCDNVSEILIFLNKVEQALN